MAQALRPYPRFTTRFSIIRRSATPGITRFSRKQQSGSPMDWILSGTFTWSKQEYIGSEQDFVPGFVNPAQNDVKNRRQNKYLSGFDQPFLFTFAANYTTPNLKGGGFIGRNKVLSWIARDWTVGAVLRYGSGLPIMVPLANNALATYLFTGGYAASPSNGTFVDPGTRSAALYSESQLPLLQSEPDFRPESEGLGGPAPGAIRHCGRILQRLPATTPAG